ncbi:ribbon-helix-helix domain-containing protein [Rhizobium sp. YIM 134829]|uniref:ribbon-helix-helix domain-containing protein n=1 Tax=Rhizobium sp. YIM 134829 TaxID=3390453 RepID=UPI00397AA428
MLKKHSTTLHGHRTSITLEDAFWIELQRLARERGLALARLIADIDDLRDETTNLSSALRLHVLAALKEEAARLQREPERG